MHSTPREGCALITAKPLKRKGLGRPAPSTPTTITESNEHQTGIKTESNSNQINTTQRQPLLKPVKLQKGQAPLIVKRIVELSDGIRASQVEYLFNDFCKRKGYVTKCGDHGSIPALLKVLIDKGEITRFKIGNVFYYAKKVA